MKTLKFILLAVISMVPLAVHGIAEAQNADRVERTPAASVVTNDTAIAERRDRIQKRKDKTSRSFTVVEQNIIKSKCRAAQGQVASTEARVKSFEAKRTKVYANLITRLEKLGTKLKTAGVDTATYDERVATLKTKKNAYTVDLTALRQALADVTAMDCAADPHGFAATLLEAKSLRENIIEKGKDIRTYMKDSMRLTLKEIRSQLRAGETRR